MQMHDTLWQMQAGSLIEELAGVFAIAGRDGNAILGHLLGSKDASRALAARAARRSGLEASQVAAILPHLAAVAMGTLALRAQAGLGEIVRQVPPLGRRSCGNPYGDLAGILRRRCGAGAYSPRALARAVRRAIGRAAGFPSRSVIGWYVRFMVGRTGTGVVRSLLPLRPAPGTVPPHGGH